MLFSEAGFLFTQMKFTTNQYIQYISFVICFVGFAGLLSMYTYEKHSSNKTTVPRSGLTNVQIADSLFEEIKQTQWKLDTLKADYDSILNELK